MQQAHEGRQIPIMGPQFLIGRDQQCHLRPASQAISKLHCAVLIRDGKVYVQDFGSTNGTMVNEAIVQGTEIAVEDGATIRIGPLDFKLKIEKTVATPDGTRCPWRRRKRPRRWRRHKRLRPRKTPSRMRLRRPSNPQSNVTKPAAPKSNPGISKPASTPAISGRQGRHCEATRSGNFRRVGTPTSKPVTSGSDTMRAITASESVSDDEQDRIAAMLLGMDEGGNSAVPDGSTVMDIPSPLAGSSTSDTRQ